MEFVVFVCAESGGGEDAVFEAGFEGFVDRESDEFVFSTAVRDFESVDARWANISGWLVKDSCFFPVLGGWIFEHTLASTPSFLVGESKRETIDGFAPTTTYPRMPGGQVPIAAGIRSRESQ